ncbi:OX-2 membrane glycoprotein [Oreochromis niloticus]|uniref:OX-2 membrane glycoprotein n=1 Tax=Oreochromis niloticus TaxID=8128 RepID=A0A669DVS4_ORENI|nr:OX-2 membrane glycoprotein [Oreochromis niloticus]
MAGRAMTFLLSLLAVFSNALTAVIQTQQTVLAAVGEDAEFSCQLLETKDVLQVTWQKISHDVEENVATYSKQFGQRVNDGFIDKFEFKHTGLQNCSIVIRNVTEQDEGCYHCLFNTYPEGSFTGRTCLQVYELHEPVVDVRESNSTEEWVVSCSATGRPAPTVTLSVSQQDLNFTQYNTVSVSNTNATFTVTTTAVLSGSRKHSTQVGCAARVLSAPHREVMVTIHEVQHTSDHEYDSSWIIVFTAVAVLLCVILLFSVLVKEKDKKRDLEKSKTPQKSNNKIDGNKTRLIKTERAGSDNEHQITTAQQMIP